MSRTSCTLERNKLPNREVARPTIQTHGENHVSDEIEADLSYCISLCNFKVDTNAQNPEEATNSTFVRGLLIA